MGLSGNWLARQQQYIDPPERLHTADVAHDQLGQAEDPRAYTYIAPAGSELGLGVEEYPGQEFVIESSGMVMDTTPDNHAPGGGDFGASREQNYAAPPMQFASERYWATRFESNDMVGVTEVALKRGLNGLPENNPDGIRRGWVEQSGVDRKLYVGERVHDARVNTPNTAYAPENAPPVGTSTGSPMGSLQRMIDRTWNTPQLRREPPPFDESLMTDGVTDLDFYDPAPQTWVSG